MADSVPAPAPAPAREPDAELIVELPDGGEHTYQLFEDEVVIAGRSPECQIHLTGDQRASRKHAKLCWTKGALDVVDLGSSNGFRINGEKRRAGSAEPEDEILIGSSRLHVRPTQGTVFEFKAEMCASCGKSLGAASVSGGRRTAEGALCPECAKGDARRPKLPGYAISRLLGSGLMGQVYLARQESSGQQVALKVLAPAKEDTSVKEALTRFAREARAMAEIDHPGAVRFIESGEADGYHYIAMEFIEGRDLETRVRDDGPLPIVHAAKIALHVLDCLAHAHRKGILHRDVKPSNIFRRKADGFVKLSDFGLAHVAQEHTAIKLSSAGRGNPRYAAPEQLRALADAGVEADVYGVAATLFYLITGRPPFDHASKAVAAVQAMEEPAPDIRTIEPKVPDALAAIIAKALAKEPAERYPSANAMAAAIKQALGPP